MEMVPVTDRGRLGRELPPLRLVIVSTHASSWYAWDGPDRW